MNSETIAFLAAEDVRLGDDGSGCLTDAQKHRLQIILERGWLDELLKQRPDIRAQIAGLESPVRLLHAEDKDHSYSIFADRSLYITREGHYGSDDEDDRDEGDGAELWLRAHDYLVAFWPNGKIFDHNTPNETDLAFLKFLNHALEGGRIVQKGKVCEPLKSLLAARNFLPPAPPLDNQSPTG